MYFCILKIIELLWNRLSSQSSCRIVVSRNSASWRRPVATSYGIARRLGFRWALDDRSSIRFSIHCIHRFITFIDSYVISFRIRIPGLATLTLGWHVSGLQPSWKKFWIFLRNWGIFLGDGKLQLLILMILFFYFFAISKMFVAIVMVFLTYCKSTNWHTTVLG